MRLPSLRDRHRRARATAADAPDDPALDEQLLAAPLDDQDLDARIAAAGTRVRARSTRILIVVALVLIGFAAGAATGRSAAEIAAAVAEQRAEVDGTLPGFEPEPGVRGTVRVVDGTSMYVELEDQTVVHVRLSRSTSVASVVDANADDLTPGTPVRVFGDLDGPAVIDATEVIGLHRR